VLAHHEAKLPGGEAHVYYPAKCPDRIRPVQYVASNNRVLHDTAGDHDDILRGICQLFDDKVDHLPKGGILVLEELRDTEEKSGGLVGRELLAGKQKQSDLC